MLFVGSTRAQTRLVALALLSTAALVSSPRVLSAQFSVFTPLSSSVAGGTLSETSPLLLSSTQFVQRVLSSNDRGALNGGVKLGDSWDMITLNENGPQAGRYMFMPYETGSAGVKRLDLLTGQSVTIVAEGTQGFVNGDASRWTPWGTYLTAEESWNGSTKGRLFEVTNPLAAPGSVGFVQRNILPRVSHEGLAFDKQNSLYFVDELNGGSIYKYVSRTPDDGSTFFNAGQTFVLQVGDGATFEGTGGATWIPITDINGAALPGIPTLVDNGVTVIDGRAAADFVKGTNFNRPEDIEIQTLSDGTQRIYFGTTDTHRLFSLNVTNPVGPTVQLFVSQSTIDAATGLAVGSGFLNPDNMAIDVLGNIYFTEDIGGVGGTGFDIWMATDADRDGVAESIGRWASVSTLGAEPSGLYFNPFDPTLAYVNIQHTTSDIDRTIEIKVVPEPATFLLLAAGMAGMLVARRGRSRRVS
jgi:secreted PhoX family phosphatase